MRGLLTDSRMAIYIDERTMEELAKVADDVEFSDSESSDDEEEDFDPFNLPQQRKKISSLHSPPPSLPTL